MKKMMLLFVVAIFITALPLSVSAAHNNHNNAHPKGNPHQVDEREDVSLPFNWHEYRGNFSPEYHRMERIADRDFSDRFYGMHAYRWHDKHGKGFMYRGHRIHDAVFFYDDADELISIGFMHEGVFVRINADCGEERSHESFFVSWMERH